jgi:hypothetical protein|tara:strand:+ start:292 stop:1362 length:1071 start_codon:yes stop_codon:yes gene_type:complete
VSFKTTAAQAQAASIGDITELKGYGQVVRDQAYPAEIDFDIASNDEVQTRAGRVAITFLDDSTVKLTEHSQLLIDKYIYDPNPDKSEMALSFASGTIRFISGNVNKLNKKNITLSTPTSQIFVRGTDFTATVDETGRSLIILLPDEFGDASGEILVSTAAGQVVLDKPYQATTTTVFENTPSKPVTLDITLELIDNLLIISPPKEEISEEQVQENQSADYLDFTDLDVDLLAEDLLEEDPDFEFTELDIDLLDVDFLEDLLDIIDELDSKEEEDQLTNFVAGINISGTAIGQDRDTQITTLLQGSQVKMIRNVNQSAQVLLDGDQSYTVIFIQDGVSKVVQINGTGNSTITIRQGS